MRTQQQSIVRRRWPTLAGLGFAILVAFDLMSGVDLAPVLAASAAVYLGAAALQRPAAAWPLFFATGAVITVARGARRPLRPDLGHPRRLGRPADLRPSARGHPARAWVAAIVFVTVLR